MPPGVYLHARRPAIERAWTFIVPEASGCWRWSGWRDCEGYGYIGVGGSRTTAAHRVTYEYFYGPIPSGLVIDHLCRAPSCVNPTHLEPVTDRENIMRGVSPTALNARKTHCPKGHPYDEANTHIRPLHGYRSCRSCNRERVRAFYYRQKSAV